MQEAPYKLHRIRKQIRTGVTQPSPCTLNAILKFDSLESPHCVYNEQVAVRIAQTLHIPTADGVLTTSGDGQVFASLEVASPGIVLPDMLMSQVKQVISQYPTQAAALVAFDVLIGNADRYRNIKASLVTSHMPIFRAFDHSHALLSIEEDPSASIERLRSTDPIVRSHPFSGHCSRSGLDRWVDRIANLDDVYLEECCLFGRPFRAVTTATQEALAEALVWRKNRLEGILATAINEIAPHP